MFSVLATLVSSISAIFLVANSVSLFSSAPQTLELKPNLVARASRLSYLFLALISFRFFYERRNDRPLAATKKECMGAAKIGPDLRSALSIEVISSDIMSVIKIWLRLFGYEKLLFIQNISPFLIVSIRKM